MPFPFRRSRDDRPAAYRYAAMLMRPVLMALTKRDWRKVQNLPRTGGCVVCVNHISLVDPLVTAHLLHDNGRMPRFLAKESVFRIPIAGTIIGKSGQIPVYRDSREAANALRAAVDSVADGHCVVIYPESTLTRDPELWPMKGKSGAARVALQTRCPVIPVAQWGAQEILAYRAKRPRLFPRKTMHLSVGEPVRLDDLYDLPLTRQVMDEATNRIMDAITRELEDLRGQSAPAHRVERPVRQEPGAA